MNFAWQQLQERGISEYAPAVATAGTRASIQSQAFVSPGLVALVLLASAVVILFVYWHERSSAGRIWKVLLAALRAVLACLVLILMYGWTIQRYRTERPDLVIMLDDSASMGIVDAFDNRALAADIQRRLAKARLDNASRMNLAKLLLLERNGNWLSTLEQRYHVKLYLAGVSAGPLTPDNAASSLQEAAADEPASRLGNCIRQVLEAQQARPTAAVILFTDGITTDGKPLSDAAQLARRKSIPLYLVGLGSDRPERDLKLDDLVADNSAFVGDLLQFTVRLTAQGYTGNVTLGLRRTDDSTVLAEKNVLLAELASSGGSQTIHLQHRADVAGDFEYVVEVLPRDDETNVDNNRLTRRVVVRDEIIRVLIVQAYPSYEFRFLKQMLLRELNSHLPADDKATGFRTVLQEADLEYNATDKTADRAFPASREELFQYDVLIFGDVNPSLLSRSMMDNIYEFVTARGGSLIFIAGPHYTPLAFRNTPIAALLPMNVDSVSMPDESFVAADAFRPQLTALGRASPVLQLADNAADNERLWSEQLAPLRWMLRMPDLHAGVRVLVENPAQRTDRGDGLPVITLHYIGAGKVVFHATDETHRWRFQSGDVFFARYWIQTIRYLCRSRVLAGNRAVELTTDREEYRRGDVVGLRIRFLDDRLAPEADDGVTVAIADESEHRQTLVLHRQGSERGVFEGSAGLLADGSYSAWLLSPAPSDSSPSIRFRVSAPPGELAHTVAGYGALRQAAEISLGKSYTFATASKLLSDLPPARRVRVESLPAQPIWNSWLVASLFTALIAIEWVLRKRVGLL